MLDAAITHALLRQVASGEKPPTARIFRPGPTMAFGRLDALDEARYAAARAAAAPTATRRILRLGGGHAAGYDEGSVLIEIIRPITTIAEGIPERFASMTALLMESLATLGITARTGELPGEYCAGDWSVNAAGVKLAGTAQRSIRGASLVTAMLIIENGARPPRAPSPTSTPPSTSPGAPADRRRGPRHHPLPDHRRRRTHPHLHPRRPRAPRSAQRTPGPTQRSSSPSSTPHRARRLAGGV